MLADQSQKPKLKNKKEDITMKKNFSLSLLSLFLLCLAVSSGFGDQAPKILEKMIEAQGGRKVLSSIKDTTLSGSMEMIQMSISGSLTMYHKEPNKMRLDGEVMGTVFTQAYDGETAWMVNPQTGNTEELTDKLAEEVKREALGNDSLLHPEKFGITYASKGKEKIEGKDYHLLEQTFSDGHTATLYIDPDTYLTFKTKAKAMNQMGIEVEAETFFSDYKKVDGVMLPHSLTILQDGEEFMKMTITEVTFNSGLEDSLFKMNG